MDNIGVNVEKEYIMVLRNKIALVTGGSRGLGKNAAIRLAQKGADVIITFHHQKEAAGAFLCSDDARWVNGQRLEVSGGVFL